MISRHRPCYFQILLCAVVSTALCSISLAKEPIRSSHRNVVAGYKAVFSKPPVRVPSHKVVDGPLLGNGDIGVVASGAPEEQKFAIGKNDFWDFSSRRIVALGGVRIDVPSLARADYHQEQVLVDAEVRGMFVAEDSVVQSKNWVDAHDNLLIQEWQVSGQNPVSVKVSHWAGPHPDVAHLPRDNYYVRIHPDAARQVTSGRSGNVIWTTRTIGIPKAKRRSATIATIIQGATCSNNQDGVLRFELTPGTLVRVITAVVSNRDAPEHQQTAIKLASDATSADVAERKRRHIKWWTDFWSESSVEIGDPLLEKFYYGSHYIMACCSRKNEVAPGLYGNWITTDNSTWWGDYHLNYNHEAPFWGLYSSNHIAQTECYDQPILDFLPQGKRLSELYFGRDGAIYPVSLGPEGMTTTREFRQHHLFLGQKYNAAYAAINMSMRFRCTYDVAYAQKIYPFLLEVATFWEQDLKFEDGRYKIVEDCVNETGSKQIPDDVNPINCMGMVKALFHTVLAVSEELDLNQDRRGKWRHILDHFSDFPTYQIQGETVFQGAESGVSANGGEGGWALVEHIWPAGMIGLESDKELLKIASNTLRLKPAWDSFNCFPMVSPAAARVGYDANQILASLRVACEKHSFPNLFIFFGGGGIECASTIPATINEMLLQTHQGTIRLFPVWPQSKDARFQTLRGYGAFLISAELKSGRVQNVVMRSERGRTCTVLNPWPGSEIRLIRNKTTAETLSGNKIVFPTQPGEEIALVPVENSASK